MACAGALEVSNPHPTCITEAEQTYFKTFLLFAPVNFTETQERSRVGPSLTTAVLQCRCKLPLHVPQQAWRREVGRLGKHCTPTNDRPPDCREVQQRSARMNGRWGYSIISRLYCSINIQYK
eukprot:COSAG01_NODE_23455_length_814_cov_3.026573_2_plen_122_part_00